MKLFPERRDLQADVLADLQALREKYAQYCSRTYDREVVTFARFVVKLCGLLTKRLRQYS